VFVFIITMIETIKEENVINILEYVELNSVHHIRRVSKYSKEILDSDKNKKMWNRISNKYCMPYHKGIGIKNSPGSTALLKRASCISHRCISCFRRDIRIYIHPFYNINMCGLCKMDKLFLISGLKTACKKYFVNPSSSFIQQSIVKQKVGNNFRVMDKHVRSYAEIVYPGGDLRMKLDNLRIKRDSIDIRRGNLRQGRMNDVERGFSKLCTENPSRVDKVLSCFKCTKSLILVDMLNMYIFGDLFSYKIRTSSNVKEASEKMYEYASMISYMKKCGLMTERYQNIYDSYTSRHIFKKYVHGGLHFYEVLSSMTNSQRLYKKRLDKMTIHLDIKCLDVSSRKKLSVSTCVEEGIEYDEDSFDEFVRYGVNNPVRIARDRRKLLFLNSNGHMTNIYRYMEFYRITEEEASIHSTNRILNVTMGYPIMDPVSYVHY